VITEGFKAANRELVAYLSRRVGCQEDAEDLAQNAWLAAVKKTSIRGGVGGVRAFVFVVAKHEAVHAQRKAKRQRDGAATLLVFGSSTPVAGCMYCGSGSGLYSGLCPAHHARRKQGRPMATPIAKRSLGRRVRLSPEVVGQVLVMLREGATTRKIAVACHISRTTIAKIRDGAKQ
jgi:hypothetical protein